MPRSRLLILLAVLATAVAANARQTEQVISVDFNGTVYIDDVRASGNLSQLAQQQHVPLFLRVDRDARAGSMCQVLVAATGRPIFFGQPKALTKAVAIAPAKSIEAVGTLPVTARAVGNSWSAEPDAIILNIDFDGTMTWNFSAVISQAMLDERFGELAVQRPHAHVYIQPNMLSKAYYVEDVAVSAKRSGFSKITIACTGSK